MGRWSSKQLAGGAGTLNPCGLSAGPSGDHVLVWTWNCADPFLWHVEITEDVYGPGTPLDTVAGSARGYDTVDGGAWYRVAAELNDGDPLGPYSNWVRLDGP